MGWHLLITTVVVVCIWKSSFWNLVNRSFFEIVIELDGSFFKECAKNLLLSFVDQLDFKYLVSIFGFSECFPGDPAKQGPSVISNIKIIDDLIPTWLFLGRCFLSSWHLLLLGFDSLDLGEDKLFCFIDHSWVSFIFDVYWIPQLVLQFSQQLICWHSQLVLQNYMPSYGNHWEFLCI